MVFDASVAATAVDVIDHSHDALTDRAVAKAADPQDAAKAPATAEPTPAEPSRTTEAGAGLGSVAESDHSALGSGAAPAFTEPSNTAGGSAGILQLVFVDPRADGAAEAVAGLGAGTKVVTLDSTRDGIRQISEALSGCSGLRAIHILSQGNDAGFPIGRDTLTTTALAGRADEVASWRDHLADGADIQLHGVDAGTGGQRIAGTLADLTGTRVTATDSLTVTDAHPADIHPAGAATDTTSAADRRIVVIDARVQDPEVLLAGLPSGVETLVIGVNDDPIARIQAALQGDPVSSLQIIAHGEAGSVTLGRDTLTADSLSGTAGEAIAAWKASFTQDADILLLGCDVGQDPAGAALLARLADLTGADVAASDDATGAAALGGDWTLEVSTGPIESRVALSATAEAAWQHLLAPPTITSPAGGDTITVIEPSVLNAAGADSATLAGWTVGDPENGTVTVTVSLPDTTVGHLDDGSTAGDDGRASLTFNGTVAAANSWLAGVRFVAADRELGNTAATTTITITVTDNEATPLSATPKTIAVTVSPSNDPAVLTTGLVTVTEGGNVALSTANLGIADPEVTAGTQSNAQIVYRLEALPAYGTLTLNGQLLGVGSIFTQDDVVNHRLSYVHTATGADQNRADSFQVSVNDGATPQAYSSAHVSTVNVAVTPVNQAPVLTTAGGSVYEGVPAGAPESSIGNFIVANAGGDPNDTLTIQLTSLPQHGSLVFTGTLTINNTSYTLANQNLASFVVSGHTLNLATDTVLIAQDQLSGLHYAHDGTEPSVAPTDSFNVVIKDAGGGTGVPASVTQAITLTINPVNDDPTWVGGSTLSATVTAGGADGSLLTGGDNFRVALTTAMINVADADSDPSSITFAVVDSPSYGRIVRDGVTVEAGGTFSLKDVIDGKVVYIQSATIPSGAPAGDSFTFAVSDNAIALRWNADGTSYSRQGGIYSGPNAADSFTIFTFNLGLAPGAGADTVSYIVTPGAPSVAEGNSGTQAVTFTVTRVGDIRNAGSVQYTVGGVDGADVASPLSGTVNFAANQATALITLTVVGDTAVEPDEVMTVTLSNPVNGQIAVGSASTTIANDDTGLSIAIDPSSTAAQFEGNSGTRSYTFTVTRTGVTTGTTAVDYVVEGTGTYAATADDFLNRVFPGGTITFNAGETSKTITVQVLGDSVAETDETFQVRLTNPTGAVLTNATAAATILDDDPAPGLSVKTDAGSVSVVEGDSGTTSLTFTVTRSGKLGQATTVDWAVVAVSAGLDATDFGTAGLPHGTISFAAGEYAKTITVSVKGDQTIEGDETFNVVLSNPTNGTLDTATASAVILNDDPRTAPVVSIAAVTSQLAEGDSGTTAFTFVVTRSGDTSQPGSVDYAVGGAAVNATDFAGGVLPSGTVSFAANEVSKTISVIVRGDTTVEPNEAFTVTLSNARYLTIGTGSATATILNDDSVPTLAISANQGAMVEGNSGTRNFTFTVTRSSGTGTAGVDWSVGGMVDAADLGGTIPSGHIDFAAGETSKTITIAVRGDTQAEADETLTVTLSNATNARITTAAATSLVVNDDYPYATVAIQAGTDTITEGNSGTRTITYTVTRTGDATGTASVDWSVVGGTANAADFAGGVLPSGTVTFAANETSRTFQIAINGDTTVEADETFTVALSNPTGVAIASGAGSAIGRILNDDGQVFTITADQARRNEGNGGSTPFTFTVSRSGDTTADVTLNWAVSGPGVTGADFAGGALPFGTVTILAGQTSATVTVNVAGDTVAEADEAFTVTLSNPSAGTIATATASSVIVNDDSTTLPQFDIVAVNGAQVEGGTGTSLTYRFTVTRTGDLSGTATVNWAVNGAAVNPANGADFGGALPFGTLTFKPGDAEETIVVTVNGDTLSESDEGFTVTLANPSGAAIGTGVAEATIIDDDPVPHVSILDAGLVKLEGNAGVTTFTFTVTRTGSTADATAVAWQVTGDAVNAADFGGALPSGTVTFAAGETSATISVSVTGDGTVEGNEPFQVTLLSATNGVIDTATATATILNDDPDLVPTVAIAAASASKAEGDSGSTPFTFTVTRTGDSTSTSFVDWTLRHNGTNAADFTGLTSGQIVFAAGETAKTITVNVAGDLQYEDNEGFDLVLTGAVGARIATGGGMASGTIVNDDPAPPSVGITTPTVAAYEGQSGSTPLTFTVTRTGDLTRATTVGWAVVGSGGVPAAAADFAGGAFPSGTVTFAAGQATATITVQVAGDTTVEPNETFTVQLTSATNGTIAASTATATGTIRNDDAPPPPAADPAQILFIGQNPASAVNAGRIDEGSTTGGLILGNDGDASTPVMLSHSAANASTAQIVYTVLKLGANGGDWYGTLQRNVNGAWQTLSAYGTFTQADLDAGRVRFLPSDGEGFLSTFQYSVSTGAIDPVTHAPVRTVGTFSIFTTPVNDAPTAAGSSGQTIAEGATSYITTAMLSFADPDDALNESYLENPQAGGVYAGNYALNHSVANPLQFRITALPDATSGTLEINTGSGWVAAQLNTLYAASILTASAGTTGLRFVHNGGEVRDAAFTVVAVDRWGASSNAATVSFTMTNVNDGPQIAANADAADPTIAVGAPNAIGGSPANNRVTVPEGSRVPITSADLQAYDPDSTTVQVQYRITQAPAKGYLARSTDGGATFSRISVGSSFTQADVAAGRIYYIHNGAEDYDGNAAGVTDDSFTFTLSDGDKEQTGRVFEIVVTPTNDAPGFATKPANPINIDSGTAANNPIKDGTTVFQVSDTDLTTIGTGETDFVQVTVRLRNIDGSLVTNIANDIPGTVNFAFDTGYAGIAPLAGADGVDRLLTVQGTRAQVNKALETLTVTFSNDLNRRYQLEVIVDDRLRDGSGALIGGANGGPVNQPGTVGAATAAVDATVYDWTTAAVPAGSRNIVSATAILRVSPVNDPQDVTVPAAQTFQEDVQGTFTGTFTLTDPESDPLDLDVRVVLKVDHGTLSVGGQTGSTITLTDKRAALEATLNGGLKYTADPNYNGPDTLTVTFKEYNAAVGGDVGAGSVANADVVKTVALTVVPVNDAPTVTAGSGALAVNSSGAVAVTGIVITDGDLTTIEPGEESYVQVTVRLMSAGGTAIADHGNLVIARGTGGLADAVTVDSTYNGNQTALVLRGTLEQVNAALAGLTVAFSTDRDDTYRLQVIVDDRLRNADGSLRDVDATTAGTQYGANGGLVNQDGATPGAVPGTDGFSPMTSVAVPSLAYNVAAAYRTLNVSSVNDPPVNQLPSALTVTEDSTNNAVKDASNAYIQITDVDDFGLSMTVVLTAEGGTLSIGDNANVTGDAKTNQTTLTLTGAKADLNAVLRTLTFTPTANLHGASGVATIRVATTDQHSGGLAAQTDTDVLSIAVTAVNDQPTYNSGVSMGVGAVLEQDTSYAATTTAVSFASLLSINSAAVGYSDAADNEASVTNSLTGVSGGDTSTGASYVAITANAAVAAQGKWQVSADGSTWFDVPTSFAANNALVLAANAQVRFAPASNFHGTPGALTIRVADASMALTTSTGASDVKDITLSANGSASSTAGAWGANGIAVAASVTSVNDRPTSSGSATVTVAEGTANPAGRLVSALVTGTLYSDGTDNTSNIAGGTNDSTSLQAIAIVGNAAIAAQGKWQVSDGAGGWIDVPTGGLSASAALIVKATQTIRFLPNGDFFGTPGALTIQVADGSTTLAAGSFSASTSDLKDLATNGGTGSTDIWSSGTSEIRGSVTNTNDAPVATGNATLASVNEDVSSPAGATVSALFSGLFTDPVENQTTISGGGNSPNSFAGVAIVGNTSVAAQGTWQYTTDGTTWTDISTSIGSGSAVILDLGANTKIRFKPASDFHGTPGGLTVRLADNSGGALTNSGGANITAAITPTGVWSNAITLGTTVTPVNDRPAASGSASVGTVMEDDANPSGVAISSLVTASNYNDNVDDKTAIAGGGNTASGLQAIAITANAAVVAQGTWQVNNGGGWITVPTTGLSATTALIMPATAQIRFVPTANFHGTPGALTVELADSSAAVTASASASDLRDARTDTAWSSTTMTITATVQNVNDRPTLSAATLTAINEANLTPAGDTVATLFGSRYSDATDNRTGAAYGNGLDASSAFGGIAIVSEGTLAGMGTWQYKIGAGAWTDVGTRSDAAALLLPTTALLRFVPANGDYNGVPTALSVRASDATVAFTDGADISGAVGPTGHWSAASTLGTTVNRVNDAPTLTATVTGLSVTENGSTHSGFSIDPVQILTDPVVADVDLSTTPNLSAATFGKGTITVSLGASYRTGDQLAISGSLPAGVTQAGGTNGTDLVISLDADTSIGEVQGILQAIRYQSSNDDPTAGGATTRTVSITLNDGRNIDPQNDDAGSTAMDAVVNGGAGPLTRTITITQRNDPPEIDLNGGGTGSDNSVTFDEAQNSAPVPVAIAPSASLTDVDNSKAVVLVMTVGGVLDGSSEVLTIGGTAFALGSADRTETVGAYSVAYTAATRTFTITPSAGTAAIAAFETLVRGITYVHLSDNPTDGDRTVQFQFRDAGLDDAGGSGQLDSNTATATINVNPRNDKPRLSGLTDREVLENTVNAGPVLIDGDVTLTDDDTATFPVGASITVSGLAATETVSLQSAATAAEGALRLSGSTVQRCSGGSWTAIAAVSGGVGADFVVTFTAAVDRSVVESVIESLTYQNSKQNPAVPTEARALTITVDDHTSGGTLQTGATVTLTIRAENDAPGVAVSGLSGNDRTIPEDTTLAFDGASGRPRITLSDVDAGTADIDVVVSVSGLGSLSLGSTAGVTVVSSSATSIALRGSQANLNSVLGTLVFNPGANANGTATIQLVVIDRGNAGQRPGFLPGDTDLASADPGDIAYVDPGANDGDATNDAWLKATRTFTVTVAPVNDAPTATITATYTTDEDTPLPLSGLSVDDAGDLPFGGAANATVTVTVGVLHGTLTLGGDTGTLTSGNGLATLTLSGTIASVNAALQNLTYTPTRDYSGSGATADTLSLSVDDGGNGGTGGALTATATKTITVLPVSDTPDLTINGTRNPSAPVTVTGNEDSDIPLATVIGETDTLGPDEVITFTLDGIPAGWVVKDNGTALTLIANGDGTVHTAVLAGDRLATLTVRAPQDWNAQQPGKTAPTLTITASSVDQGAAPATRTGRIVLNVAPVSDDTVPTNDADSLTEDTADVSKNAASGVLANDRDVDLEQTLRVQGVAAGNTGAVPTDGVGSAVTGTWGQLTLNADGSYSYRLDTASVQFLRDGQTRTDVFTYTVNDADGLGAPKTATLTITITGLNDAPVVDLNGAVDGTSTSLTYTEVDGADTSTGRSLWPSATLTDPDSGKLAGLTITASNILDGNAELLRIGATEFALGTSTAAPATVTAGGTSFSVSVVASGTGAIITITPASGGAMALTDAQALLAGVTYRDTSDTPNTSGTRGFAVQVTDAGSNDDGTPAGSRLASNTATASVTVVATNEAPVVDLNGADAGSDNAVTYTEIANGAEPELAIAPAATLADVDNANLTRMVLTVGSVADGAQEFLTIGGTRFAIGTDVAAQVVDAGALGRFSVTVSTAGTDRRVDIRALGAGSTVAVDTKADVAGLLQGITYSNTSDNPTGTRTIAVQVTDAGTDDAITADDERASNRPVTTISFVVANDQPRFSGAYQDRTVRENAVNVTGGAPVALIGNPAAVTLSDADSPTYLGGSIAVTGLAADDVLSLPATVTVTGAEGAVRLTGGTTVQVYAGGDWRSIGTLSGGNGATLTITINGADAATHGTVANVERVIEALTYQNSSDRPTPGPRTLTISVNDGGAGIAGTTTLALTVVPENDRPVITGFGPNAPTFTEDGAPVVLDAHAALRDADIGDADLGDGTGGPNDYRGVVLTFQRSGGTPNAEDRFGFNGSAATVNSIYTSGTGLRLANGTADASDDLVIGTIDTSTAGRLRVTLGGTATVTQEIASRVIQAVTYANASENVDGLSAGPVSIDLTVDDRNGTAQVNQGEGSALATTATTAVAIVPVNEPIRSGAAPVLTQVAYAENAAPQRLFNDPAVTITDNDNATFNGGVVTASFTSGGRASDRLVVVGSGDAASNGISLSGGSVLWDADGSGPGAAVVIGTLSGGTDADTPLSVALNGNATPAAVQALIRQIAFVNGSDDPVGGAGAIRTVSVDVRNGAVGAPTTQTATGLFTNPVRVTPENDAPVIDRTDGSTITGTTITEWNGGGAYANGGDTVASLVALLGADAHDADNRAGGVGTPTDGLGLAVTGVLNADGRWQYSTDGTTWADIPVGTSATAALLLNPADRVRFVPTALFNGDAGARLTLKLWDRTSNGTDTTADDANTTDGDRNTGDNDQFSSRTVVLTARVSAVNDAPVNSVPGTLTGVREDTAFTFAGANAFSIADVDVNENPDVTNRTLTVTLTARHGVLTLGDAATRAGVSFGTGDGLADATVTATGTLANLRALLGSVTYTGDANFNGTDSITITTNDRGNYGSGGPLQDVDTVTFTVEAVNDAPTVTSTAAVVLSPVAEDIGGAANTGSTVGDLFAARLTDAPDAVAGGSSANTFAGIAIVAGTADPAKGQWQYQIGGTGAWTNVGDRTLATALLLGSGDRLRFQPAGDFNGPAPQLGIRLVEDGSLAQTGGTVVDLSGAAATGGETRYADAANQLTLATSVTAVNDRPVVTGSGPVTIAVTEDSTPAGATFTSLLAGRYTDATDDQAAKGGSADATELRYVAVVGNASVAGQGSWQYLANGTTWTDIPTTGLSAASALVLDAATQVRFVPAADFHGAPGALTLRLADGSANPVTASGSAADLKDLSTNGGTDPTGRWSAGSVDLKPTVANVNDAPTATGTATLPAIAEDTPTTAIPGATVASLFGPLYGDAADNRTGIAGGADASTPALAGIAIVGNAATAAQGQWRYSTDGTTWTALPSGLSDTNALVLPTTASLRFVPVVDWNGTPGGLTVRLSDAPVSAAAGGQTLAIGGTTPWSATTVSLGTSVTAVEDAIEAANDTNTIVEDATAPATGNVLANDVDRDALGTIAPQTLYVTAIQGAGAAKPLDTSANNAVTVAGRYGTLTIRRDGGYSYALDSSLDVIQQLRQGQTLTDEVFTYTVDDVLAADGSPAGSPAVSRTLGITITGVNDAPVAKPDTGAIREDAATPATGAVLANDVEIDANDPGMVTAVAFGPTAGAVGTGLRGGYGTLTLKADGSWSYALDNGLPTVQALAAGETLTETFTYTVTDTAGASSGSTLTITITGTNDAPVIGADGTRGAVVEDAASPTLTSTGTIAFTDLDLTNTHTVAVGAATVSTSAGIPAGLVPAGGFGTLTARVVEDAADASNAGEIAWSFAVDNTAVQALAAGETVTQVYRLTLKDTSGAEITRDVTITITGANDTPVVGTDKLTGAVTEDAGSDATLTDSGTIAFSDVDLTDAHTVTSAFVSTTGSAPLGALTAVRSADTTGTGTSGQVTWTYSVDNAKVQFLAAGQTVTETYAVTVSDGQGGTVTRNVVVTITGTNDAPTVTGAPPTVAGIAGQAMTLSVDPARFADVDRGDRLTFTATLANGSPLPNWLVFDPATLTFRGTPPQEAAGTLALTLRATDTAGASATLGVTFTITAEVQRGDTPTTGTPTPTAPVQPTAPTPTPTSPDSLITGTGNSSPTASIITGTTPPADGLTTGFTANPLTQVQAADNGGFGAGAVNAASGLNRQQGNGDLSTAAIFRQTSQANVELFLAGSVGNQTLLPQQQASFQVPKNIFRHTNPNERLVYQAVRPDGSPLPNWLQFDAQNLAFRGVPPAEARGALDIVIVAKDSRGNQAAAQFRVLVTQDLNTQAPIGNGRGAQPSGGANRPQAEGQQPPGQGEGPDAGDGGGEGGGEGQPAVRVPEGQQPAGQPPKDQRADAGAPESMEGADAWSNAGSNAGPAAGRTVADATPPGVTPLAGRASFTAQLHAAGRPGLLAEARALLNTLLLTDDAA